MIIDNNLIAYEYNKAQYPPNKVNPSGAKDEAREKSNYFLSKNEYALLIIEEDIINSEGYGLKKGFYNVTTDEYMDFLYIFQSGKIKAKIPVAKMTAYEPINPQQFKVEKLSQKKFKKQQKQKQKNDFEEITYKKAQIQYLDEANSYILIYNTSNVELVGIIKF